MTEQETRTEVWCLTCMSTFGTQDATAVIEFAPQGVSLDPDGRLDLGHPNEAHMDYVHLVCGTKVRFSGYGAWEDPENPRPYMIEVDAPGGTSCALMMDALTLELDHRLGQGGTDLTLGDAVHEHMVKSREVMIVLRNKAFSGQYILDDV